jgi:hypothetical protein
MWINDNKSLKLDGFYRSGITVSLVREECSKCCNVIERDYFEDLSVDEMALLKFTGFVFVDLFHLPHDCPLAGNLQTR